MSGFVWKVGFDEWGEDGEDCEETWVFFPSFFIFNFLDFVYVTMFYLFIFFSVFLPFLQFNNNYFVKLFFFLKYYSSTYHSMQKLIRDNTKHLTNLLSTIWRLFIVSDRSCQYNLSCQMSPKSIIEFNVLINKWEVVIDKWWWWWLWWWWIVETVHMMGGRDGGGVGGG